MTASDFSPRSVERARREAAARGLPVRFSVADMRQAAAHHGVMRSQLYAVGTDKLMELMRQAGFAQVERLDGRFYQPMLVGRRAAEPGVAADPVPHVGSS